MPKSPGRRARPPTQSPPATAMPSTTSTACWHRTARIWAPLLPLPLRWLERFLFHTLPTVMNDANIEHLLRTLHPAAPSPELTARVERDLALAELFRDAIPPASSAPARQASKRGTWVPAMLWVGLGAAAAVLVMAILP